MFLQLLLFQSNVPSKNDRLIISLLAWNVISSFTQCISVFISGASALIRDFVSGYRHLSYSWFTEWERILSAKLDSGASEMIGDLIPNTQLLF